MRWNKKTILCDCKVGPLVRNKYSVTLFGDFLTYIIIMSEFTVIRSYSVKTVIAT